MYQSVPTGLTGELATTPGGACAKARKAARAQVEIGAGLRQRGAGAVTIQILDLSTHGFRASTHLELQVGTEVWLKLPNLEAWHARVAWMNGHLVGCEFLRPLHPAVLDMIVRSRN
jgi:hypothetical protein